MAADESYGTLVRLLQGGTTLDVKTGGKITANGTQASHLADLEAAYETPELDTEAEIIVAINATNTAINAIFAALEGAGILASS